MIPDTSMYSRRKLMFLIVGGRYYNASNSRDVNQDYLTLCGLKFPLTQGGNLEEEETTYMKRNARVMEEFKEDLERKINTGKESVPEIENDIKRKKDVLFFLKEICVEHARKFSQHQNMIYTTQSSPIYSRDKDAIFPKIIQKDYAVINERLYPLINSELPVFVSLKGKNYSLSSGEKTVGEVNSSFKQMLSQKLRLDAMQKCGKVKELERERQCLGNDIDARLNSLNVFLYRHAIEWNNDDTIVGYDTTSKLLYCLIAPHQNQTTGQGYSEGQAVAALPFENMIIGTTAKFYSRNSRDSPLIIPSQSQCSGDLKLLGQTITDKLIYIRALAHQIFTNRAFYQVSDSSSSYDSGYSY